MKISSILVILSLMLALSLLVVQPVPANAQGVEEAGHRVALYLFWGEGCPSCASEKKFLETLALKYPTLEVHAYEVWYNEENAEMFTRMATAYRVNTVGIPATFVGDSVWIGYWDYTGVEIEAKIAYGVENGSIDPIDKLSESPPDENSAEPTVPEQPEASATAEHTIINLPLFGPIEISKMSLVPLTLILGAMDGFNPCAFFVLFLLLGILIRTRSRKRMLLVGGMFVFFSAALYFLFMSAWLNLFLILGEIRLITMIAGAVALIIAAINVKDFFSFRKGVSLSIPEQAKPRLFERIRKLMETTAIPGLIVGTIILAVTANTYELLCTAGFPMVFTRTLTLHDLPIASYYLYLLLYNTVYVAPLVLIVTVFVTTLGNRKLTEFQGRVLKLASGLLMLGLGLVLLVNPAILNSIVATIGILVAALVTTAVTAVIQRHCG